MKAILTDGYETFDEVEITSIDELVDLNHEARIATDGNILWVLSE